MKLHVHTFLVENLNIMLIIDDIIFVLTYYAICYRNLCAAYRRM